MSTEWRPFVSQYKKGTFVNITNSNPTEWEANFRRIGNLSPRQHIEIWLEYIPTGRKRTILREMLGDMEVIIHGPFIHMSLVTHLNALGEISLKRCNETVEFATLIGAKVVTFHAGTYPIFEKQEVAFERLARRFSGFVALKAPVVTLENMPVKRGTTRECLGKLDDLRLLQSIIPDIHFTLDIGHSLQNGDDFESFLREQSSCISNIHLHDGMAGGRSHLRLGAGTLDLPKLIGLLRDVGFSKYVTLETISLEDTELSWAAWLNAERRSQPLS